MGHVISKDGTKIEFDTYGSGPPLILITGAICFRKFKPVENDAKVFGQKFTVYSYDRRGRGDSSDTLPYSIEKEIEDIEALIAVAGGKVALYGHSSGAVLALEAALRLPSKVSRIVLYDAAYAESEAAQAPYMELNQKVKNLLSDGKNTKALQTFVAGIGMPKLMAFLLPLMPGFSTMKALAPTLLYDMELTRVLPPVSRLSQLQVPAKVLYGDKSPASMKIVAESISQASKLIQLVVVKGQDHMVSPKVLLPLLAE